MTRLRQDIGTGLVVASLVGVFLSVAAVGTLLPWQWQSFVAPLVLMGALCTAGFITYYSPYPRAPKSVRKGTPAEGTIEAKELVEIGRTQLYKLEVRFTADGGAKRS